MAYSVKIRITVTNPPWKIFFSDFLRKHKVPLTPLVTRTAARHRTSRKSVPKAQHSWLTLILIMLAIPVGIAVMASFFAIPVILFYAAMGWIH